MIVKIRAEYRLAEPSVMRVCNLFEQKTHIYVRYEETADILNGYNLILDSRVLNANMIEMLFAIIRSVTEVENENIIIL